MGMIVVEGPDGAGKSTLVSRIEEDYNITRQAKTVSKEAKPLVTLDDYVEEELRKPFEFRLYDRFALISAPMYITLPNRTFAGKFTDPLWLRIQFNKFHKLNPVIIVCLPSLETVVENVHKDSDNEVVKDHIENIYWMYHNWYCSQVNNTSVMLWDYNNPNPIQLGSLIRWAQTRSYRRFSER